MVARCDIIKCYGEEIVSRCKMLKRFSSVLRKLGRPGSLIAISRTRENVNVKKVLRFIATMSPEM